MMGTEALPHGKISCHLMSHLPPVFPIPLLIPSRLRTSLYNRDSIKHKSKHKTLRNYGYSDYSFHNYLPSQQLCPKHQCPFQLPNRAARREA